MARKCFPTSNETRKVINGCEVAVAKAKGCSESYIYNIKNLEEPDPYPPFREWFQFCAIGGGDVREYLHDLEAIACQAERGNAVVPSKGDKLVNLLDADHETERLIAAANIDNTWDARECDLILAACDRMDAEVSELRTMAQANRTDDEPSELRLITRTLVKRSGR